MNDSRYQYAFDTNGNVVYVDEATLDQEYFCPLCHQNMIPKNQSEKWSHRHFIHCNTNVLNNQRESSIHYNVKWFFFSQ